MLRQLFCYGRLSPLAAVFLLNIATQDFARGSECKDVNIPIIGIDLLKDVQTYYVSGNIPAAIGKLETFITINKTQLTEDDEPLSDQQRYCIGELANENNFRLAHFYQINRQYNKAEDILREVLMADPDHYNSRLSLAQIMARRKEYRSALYHLRFAMGGDAPVAVQNDIKSILTTVNNSPTTYFNMSAAIAPDTNINRATQNRDIDLDINGTSFPFVLGDDSLASSGIGVVISANARYETPLADNLLLRFDGVGSWLNFRDSEFDDIFLRSQSGLRWLYDNGSISAQGILARQWFAGEGFATVKGGRIGWEHNLLSTFRYGINFEQSWQKHDHRKDLDGPQTRISIFSTYQLSASSLLNSSISWTSRTAQTKRFGYSQGALDIGYIREFPLGLSFSLSQYISLRNHRDIEPFFTKKRSDVFSRSFIQITKRNWSIWGLVPVIGYGFSRNYSNIDLFGYSRHQIQVGFTKLL